LTTEILINVAPRENRAALIENGVLMELFVERQSRRGIVSNLYKGRVQRVLPGMQAAFVDVGLDRTAFLHAADISTPVSDNTLVGMPEPLDIRRLVNEGDDILVQVVKDPMGTKGARLTTFVALPSRLMVYMPRGEGVGVSARIEEEAERGRLKALVTQSIAEMSTGENSSGKSCSGKNGGGYIVRTAAQGASADAIREDMKYLCRLWQHVREKGLMSRAGDLVYGDLPLPTASTGCWWTTRCHMRACSSSRPASCRAAPRASSCIRVSGRSSICTASRTKSARRSSAASA
jgi:ribonuclease G